MDEQKLKENKDKILQRFISGVEEISEGKIPEYFRGTTYSLEHTLEDFPREQQEELQKMVVTAHMQQFYLEAQRDLRIYEQGYEEREQEISEFLKKYQV